MEKEKKKIDAKLKKKERNMRKRKLMTEIGKSY
jgi:hypothetical protein